MQSYTADYKPLMGGEAWKHLLFLSARQRFLIYSAQIVGIHKSPACWKHKSEAVTASASGKGEDEEEEEARCSLISSINELAWASWNTQSYSQKNMENFVRTCPSQRVSRKCFEWEQ